MQFSVVSVSCPTMFILMVIDPMSVYVDLTYNFERRKIHNDGKNSVCFKKQVQEKTFLLLLWIMIYIYLQVETFLNNWNYFLIKIVCHVCFQGNCGVDCKKLKNIYMLASVSEYIRWLFFVLLEFCWRIVKLISSEFALSQT